MNEVENSVTQIIYTSSAIESFTKENLRELLSTSRENNRKVGISGMLVYDDGFFLQVMEGDQTKVDALFDKIRKDPRHTGLNLLLKRQIKEKQFDEWAMGFLDNSLHAGELEGFIPYGQLRYIIKDKNAAEKQINKFRKGAWRFRVESD